MLGKLFGRKPKARRGEDPLLASHVGAIKELLLKLGMREDEAISHAAVTRAVEKAQRRMMQSGSLVSINVSEGGVPKLPVTACRVTRLGLDGDRQRDLHYHGGLERAVSLFSLEQIQALQAEGHPIASGTIGENLTLGGLDWARVVPGGRVSVGPVVLELTRYAAPCRNIAGSFADGDISRVSQKLRPGWSRLYARVLEEGVVRTGDPVSIADGDA